MRSPWIIAVLLIAGCAHVRLAAAPPAGVDLSGHWRLNAAESDDPERLVGLLAGGGDAPAGDRRGGDDDGSGRASRDGGAREPAEGALPARVAIGAIAEAMQWPGKDLVIKQVGGVAAFSSDGESRVYQPDGATLADQGRGRRAADPCGWSGGALLVSATADDDGPPLELRYEVSVDRRRLVERISRPAAGGGGIAMIRVWDRVP